MGRAARLGRKSWPRKSSSAPRTASCWFAGAFLKQAFREVPSCRGSREAPESLVGASCSLLPAKARRLWIARTSMPQRSPRRSSGSFCGAPGECSNKRQGPGCGTQGAKISWCERLKKLKGGLTRDLNVMTRMESLAASSCNSIYIGWIPKWWT